MACKYETKSGRCGLKVCYAYKHTCYTRDCCKCWEPVTNTDRIRAMSDEELAEFIPNWSYTKACKCDEQRFVDCNNECEKCVADWLQQPAPEEGQDER